MLQPICGYVLDVIGLKLGLRDLRDRLVVHQHGARAGRQLDGAVLAARTAGARRRIGESGGHEGDVGVVSRRRSAASPAASSTSARRSARCSRRRSSRGRSSAYNWQTAFVITGALGLVWVVLWLLALRVARRSTRRCRHEERHHILSGQEQHLAGRRHAAVDRQDPRAAELLGDRAAAVSRRSDLGHAHVLAAALSDERPALRPEADRAVRLAAVPGRRSRLPVRRHDQPVRCRSASASA